MQEYNTAQIRAAARKLDNIAEQTKANAWYKQMVEIVHTYVTNLQNAAKSYQEADNQAASNIKSK